MTRIATFNVNGVNGRLHVLLKWLDQSNYDIVCLQELKASDENSRLSLSGRRTTRDRHGQNRTTGWPFWLGPGGKTT